MFIGHWGLEMEFLDWYRKVHVRHLKPKPDQETKLQKIGTLVDPLSPLQLDPKGHPYRNPETTLNPTPLKPLNPKPLNPKPLNP